MSWKPRAFAASPPTGRVCAPEVAEIHAIEPTVASSTEPSWNGVGVPARHANSHSASVGNRMPAGARNDCAPVQLTRSTGRFGTCAAGTKAL